MRHIDRQSIKSIFLLIQSIVILSAAAILATNLWMINGFHSVMETTAVKNEVLSNIFEYNTVLKNTVYQYVQRPEEELRAEYERQKESCIKEFEGLMRGISLHRTKVMFGGLKNMYLTSFDCADAAILYRDAGEVERAYASYRELVRNAGLINDVVAPMYSLNTKDMHFYLEEQMERSRISTRLILASQLLGMTLIIGMLTHEMREIKKKIAGLKSYADHVSRQEYDKEPAKGEIGSRNELDGLGMAMADMARSIQKYVAIIEEKDRQALQMVKAENEYLKLYGTMRDAQIKALNSQINPHFLYNTLETISSIAAVRQVFVVCDMCQRLGEIFRYSLGKNYGEIVPLQQELDHIKNYIFIQKIRYGNRFQVCYNIEAGSEQYKIMRFLLQPIVENAILHGLAGGNPGDAGILEIAVALHTNALEIKVRDNGAGMEEQKVAELLEYINSGDIKEDAAKSIGIRNVNQRIKLACGEKYGVTIESYPAVGSCFTVRLPVIRGEEDNET